MINFKQLENLFDGLTSADALDCLCWVFGASRAVIYRDNIRVILPDLYDDWDTIGLSQATEVKLRFYGGPFPGKWWDGNLFTMFLDHFIYAYTTNKKQTVQKALKVARQRVA